jgi:hypothetical protein
VPIVVVEEQCDGKHCGAEIAKRRQYNYADHARYDF